MQDHSLPTAEGNELDTRLQESRMKDGTQPGLQSPLLPISAVALRSLVVTFVVTVTIITTLLAATLLVLWIMRPSAEERAIQMARSYVGSTWQLTIKSILVGGDLDTFAISKLPKDVVKVIGWKAERVGDSKYLVSFTYESSGGRMDGYWYEVYIDHRVVVTVTGNRTLEQKYGLIRDR